MKKKKRWFLLIHGILLIAFLVGILFFCIKKIKEVPYNPTNPKYIKYLLEKGVEFPKGGIDGKLETNPDTIVLMYQNGGYFIFKDGTVIDNTCSAEFTESLRAYGYGDLVTEPLTENESRNFFRRHLESYYNRGLYYEQLFRFPTKEEPKNIAEKQELCLRMKGEYLGETRLAYSIEEWPHTKFYDAEVYQIKNVKPDAAVLIKPLESEEYSVFTNIKYKPKTLGDYLSDLDFPNKAENVSPPLTDEFWDVLWSLADTEAYGFICYEETSPITFLASMDIPMMNGCGQNCARIRLGSMWSDEEKMVLTIDLSKTPYMFLISRTDGERLIEAAKEQ